LENNIILSAGTYEYTKLRCVDEDNYYNFSPIIGLSYFTRDLGLHTLKYHGIVTKI